MRDTNDLFFETTSAEEANRLRQRGWQLMGIQNSKDESGGSRVTFRLRRPVANEGAQQDTSMPSIWSGPSFGDGQPS